MTQKWEARVLQTSRLRINHTSFSASPLLAFEARSSLMWGSPVHCGMFASIPCPPPDASSTPPPLFATKLSHVILRCSPGAPSESHRTTVIRWHCLRSNKWNRIVQKKYLTFWKVLSSWKASLIAQLVKTPSSMQETPVQFLGQEDPLRRDRLS